nr:DnaD domain protein [Cytobacillus firmus]
MENPVQLFEKLLCRLSPNQMEKLYQWQDDFSGQAEIINEAIRIADDKNKRFFGFVEFLLKEWANNKLDSLDRVKAYEQEKFNKAKIKPYPRKGVVRTEMLPEWFDESNQPKQEKRAMPEDDLARKKAELNEKLKKLKSGS